MTRSWIPNATTSAPSATRQLAEAPGAPGARTHARRELDASDVLEPLRRPLNEHDAGPCDESDDGVPSPLGSPPHSASTSPSMEPASQVSMPEPAASIQWVRFAPAGTSMVCVDSTSWAAPVTSTNARSDPWKRPEVGGERDARPSPADCRRVPRRTAAPCIARGPSRRPPARHPRRRRTVLFWVRLERRLRV